MKKCTLQLAFGRDKRFLVVPWWYASRTSTRLRYESVPFFRNPYKAMKFAIEMYVIRDWWGASVGVNGVVTKQGGKR